MSFIVVVVVIVTVIRHRHRYHRRRRRRYLHFNRSRFFLLLPSLFISDRRYDFFVLFHVHLSSRPNFKISTCLFLFFFFFSTFKRLIPSLFFSSLFYTFISHPPSHPFLSPQNYVALHIAQFSIHLIFLLTTFPYRIFPPYVRTFFHCFFEYFSLSSPYLTNAPLPNPFFNFFPHSLVRAPSRMLVSSRFASLQDLEISRSSQSKKVRPKSFSRALVTDRKKPVFHAFASSSNCSMADLSSRII